MGSIIQAMREFFGRVKPLQTHPKPSEMGDSKKVSASTATMGSSTENSLTLVHPAVLDHARRYLKKMPTPAAAERMPRARILVSFIGKYGRPEAMLCDAIGEHADETVSMVFGQNTALLDIIFAHSPTLLRKLFWMSENFLLTLFRHESRVLHAIFGHSHFVLERLLQHSDALLRQMAGKSGDTLYQIFRHDDRVVEKICSPSDSVMAVLLAHGDRVLQRVFGHSNDFYLSNLFSHDDRFLAELFKCPGQELDNLFSCDDYLLEKLFSFDAEEIIPFLRDIQADPRALADHWRIAEGIAELEQRLRGSTEVTDEKVSRVRVVLERVEDQAKRAALARFYTHHCLADPSLISRVFDDSDALVAATEAISPETLDDMLAMPPDVLKAIFSLPLATFYTLFRQGDTLLGWIFLYPPFVTRQIFVRSSGSVGQIFSCPETILRKLFQHHDTVLEKLFEHSDIVLGRVLSHPPEILDWLFSQSDRVLWNLFCHSEAILAKIFSPDEGVLALTLLFTADDAHLLQILARGDDELKQMFAQLYVAPDEALTAGVSPVASMADDRRLRLDRQPIPEAGAVESDILLRALRRESVSGADLLDLVFSHSDTVLQELFGMPNTTLAAVLMLPPDVLRKLFWYPDRTLHAVFVTHDPLVERAFFALSSHALRRILACADDVIEQMFNHSDHVLLKLFDCHDAILINLFSHSADVLQCIFRLSDQTFREVVLASNTMLWEISLRSDDILERLFSCPEEAIEALFQCDKPLLEDLFSWEDDVIAEVINFIASNPRGDVAETVRRLLTQTRIVDPEYSVKENDVKDVRARALIASLDTEEQKQPFLNYYGKYTDIRPALIDLVFERQAVLYRQLLECGTDTVWHLLSLPPAILRSCLRRDGEALAAALTAPPPTVQHLFSASPLVIQSMFSMETANLRLVFAHREGVLNSLFSHADAVLVALFDSDDMLLRALFGKSDEVLRHLFGLDTTVLWNLLLHDPVVISRMLEADEYALSKLFTEERRVLMELFSSEDDTLRDFVAHVLRNPGANFRGAAQEIGALRTIMRPDCYEEGTRLMALEEPATLSPK